MLNPIVPADRVLCEMRRLVTPWLIAITMLGMFGSIGSADDAPPVTITPTMEFDPAHAEKMRAGLDLFKSKVREVLIRSCVDCHGGAEVKSGLDLATRKGLVRGGTHGPSIVVGKSLESNVWRFAAHKQKPFMPEDGDKLPDEEIDAIAKWIDLGAPYDAPLVENPRNPDAWTSTAITAERRQFWSFLPLQAAAPPQVKRENWVRNDIDRYILAKQEEKGIVPAEPATKAQLIRRAYFDLLGLPPTPQQIDQFVQDTDPQAYEKLIAKLLDNPAYGERWGRHWLDVARFAESHGFEQDYDRPHAYHFRDFVIQALNQDLPYNQFIKWQLAGDEYEPENPLALMATGFLGAGVYPTQITANEVERTRYDALDDMAATIGSGMLGMSIGCARCHDHKFDPIPQADYYRFISTFTTTVRGNVDVDMAPKEYKEAKAKFDTAHAPLQEALKKFEATELPARFAKWEEAGNVQKVDRNWTLLDFAQTKSKGGADFAKQPDGSIRVQGANPDFDTYELSVKVAARTITAIRLEAMADAPLVKSGPGRAPNGNFDLTDFKLSVVPTEGAAAQVVKLKLARATFEQPGLAVANAIDDNPKSGWAVDPQFGKDHVAIFELETPLVLAADGTIQFTLDFQGNNKHNLGRIRLSVSGAASPLPLTSGGIDLAVDSALSTPVAKRTAEQQQTLLRWYSSQDEQWKVLAKAVDDHLAQAPKPKLVPVMICSEGIPAIRHHTQGGDFLPETHFLKRGDCDQKQGVASPSFLQVLMNSADAEKHWQQTPPQGSKTSYRRRALAEWITDTDQGAGHLLARVIANRLWHLHFGQGIVTTPSDFGVQGQRPTHPELLDYLATQLIKHDWHLKKLHQQIMLSSTYMQANRSPSAEIQAANQAIDPGNQWVWRRAPRRLEAEIVRDNLLAVSGTLDPTMYGPGSLSEAHRRRSIYFTIKRSQLIPMMQLFDQPEPLVSVGGRSSTTIAPQALMLMNHPQVRIYAHAFADRLLAEAGTATDNKLSLIVRNGYRTAIGREPDASELEIGAQFLQSQSESYAQEPSKKDQALKLAVSDFCQALFGLNEFVYTE